MIQDRPPGDDGMMSRLPRLVQAALGRLASVVEFQQSASGATNGWDATSERQSKWTAAKRDGGSLIIPADPRSRVVMDAPRVLISGS